MKLIIFDADGTLRRCTVEGQPCPNSPDEWELLPNVKEVLARIQPVVFYGIASNQAGVALDFLTEQEAGDLLIDLFVTVFGGWPTPGDIQLCPHCPSAGCECRKPRPLMLRRIMASWAIQPSETLFVGDMESDRLAAENAGCDFMWAKDFFGWDED